MTEILSRFEEQGLFAEDAQVQGIRKALEQILSPGESESQKE